jgi:hypothetical protein
LNPVAFAPSSLFARTRVVRIVSVKKVDMLLEASDHRIDTATYKTVLRHHEVSRRLHSKQTSPELLLEAMTDRRAGVLSGEYERHQRFIRRDQREALRRVFHDLPLRDRFESRSSIVVIKLGCAPIPKTESELEIPFAPAYGTLGIAAARLRRIGIGAEWP